MPDHGLPASSGTCGALSRDRLGLVLGQSGRGQTYQATTSKRRGLVRPETSDYFASRLLRNVLNAGFATPS